MINTHHPFEKGLANCHIAVSILSYSVPAKTETQFLHGSWIPVFAGMPILICLLLDRPLMWATTQDCPHIFLKEFFAILHTILFLSAYVRIPRPGAEKGPFRGAYFSVIPAKAGIQAFEKVLDFSGLRLSPG